MCEEQNNLEFERLLMSTMTWSFSRLDSFDDCPYAWKLHYLDGNHDCGSCFSQYGLAAHKTLEEWEKGQVDIFSICDEYDRLFNEYITWNFPSKANGGDMRSDYYQKGLNYFSSLTDELEDKEILGVEEKVEFEISGKPFIGFIDLRYRDKDGRMICEDHKSSGFKLLKSGKPAKAYQEKMKRYERQQYLYTIPFVENGEKVDALRWNFFKEGFHYEIPWTEEGYHEAIKWAEDTLKKIESTEVFDPVYVTRKTKNGTKIEPKPGYMFCNFICGQREACNKKNAMFLNEEKD